MAHVKKKGKWMYQKEEEIREDTYKPATWDQRTNRRNVLIEKLLLIWSTVCAINIYQGNELEAIGYVGRERALKSFLLSAAVLLIRLVLKITSVLLLYSTSFAISHINEYILEWSSVVEGHGREGSMLVARLPCIIKCKVVNTQFFFTHYIVPPCSYKMSRYVIQRGKQMMWPKRIRLMKKSIFSW